MEQYVEEYIVGSLHTQAQEILGDGQVAGAGDRQKFCHALDDPQEQSVQYGHGKASSINIFFYDSTTAGVFP